MSVRYKIGKFDYEIIVIPGDRLCVSIRDEHSYKDVKVEEEITAMQKITHWVMFYAPEIGFGGMFGGPNIGDRVHEVFVNPVQVKLEDSLFKEYK